MNATALDKLRQFEQRRCEIEAHFRRLIEHCAASVRTHRKNLQRFFAEYALENFERVVESKMKLDATQQIAHVLNKQIQTGDLCGSKFRAECPEFRNVLLAACDFRLNNAQLEFDRILFAEAKRLSAKGFDAAQIETSPEVKRARGKVEGWTRRRERINNDSDQDVWRNNAHAILAT